uniref:F-box domain-containing protein n=1 Tax=Bicosoecida sp. CB-2014 TaxID=1486930 RepID=A0A7S1G9K1_9STRA
MDVPLAVFGCVADYLDASSVVCLSMTSTRMLARCRHEGLWARIVRRRGLRVSEKDAPMPGAAAASRPASGGAGGPAPMNSRPVAKAVGRVPPVPPSMHAYQRWAARRTGRRVRRRGAKPPSTMAAADAEHGVPALFKVLMLGAVAAGKTTLMRCVGGGCGPVGEEYPCTIGVDFTIHRSLAPGGTPTKLQIWDGSYAMWPPRRYGGIYQAYLRGVDVICWVYDAADRQSFIDTRAAAQRVMRQVREMAESRRGLVDVGHTSLPDVMPLHFIVGAKSDRVAADAAPAVSEADVAAFAAELVGDDMGCLRHVMTSAATGAGVDDFARTVACALEADSLDDEAAAEAGVRRIRGRDYSNDAWGQCAFM